MFHLADASSQARQTRKHLYRRHHRAFWSSRDKHVKSHRHQSSGSADILGVPCASRDSPGTHAYSRRRCRYGKCAGGKVSDATRSLCELEWSLAAQESERPSERVYQNVRATCPTCQSSGLALLVRLFYLGIQPGSSSLR